MDWMLLIVNRKDVPSGETVAPAEMARYGGELVAAGRARGDAPLRTEAEGARVRVQNGRALVTDGPFAEAKEVVAGYFAVDAATREQAIGLALRCPAARSSSWRVEVRAAPDRDVAGLAQGAEFMLLLHMPPELTDPDGAKYREMLAFDAELKRAGAYVESAALPLDPKPARVETRDGRIAVLDGPFAEAKEVCGGYYVVSAPDRAAALALAARCPHARWGDVEVRPIMSKRGRP